MITAAMNTLKQIRDALKVLQHKQGDSKLTKGQRAMVEEGILLLSEQEDIIINNSLQDMVSQLNKTTIELNALTARMTRASNKIDDMAKLIKKIAGVVSVLTDIITKAASVGIL